MKSWKIYAAALTALSLCSPTPLIAQDEGLIIVTASRSDDSYYDDEQSAIGLRKKADYFVQQIYVSSDSRDADTRKDEVKTMLRDVIKMAPGSGIELVAGDYKLEPVTLGNMDDLSLRGGRRPDTSRVTLYAKIPVGRPTESTDEASKIIKTFVERIPVKGRSFIEQAGVELAITEPDKYRHAVVKEIAKEATRYASYFGDDYGVEVGGLQNELSWTQISENEVLLYIPHSFDVKPK